MDLIRAHDDSNALFPKARVAAAMLLVSETTITQHMGRWHDAGVIQMDTAPGGRRRVRVVQ